MFGQMHVESDAGQGSRFYFTLPLGLQPDQAVSLYDLDVDFHGKHALVIDGNKVAGDSLARTLGAMGYQAQCVSTGGEAKTAFKKADVSLDIIFVSYTLPDQTGLSIVNMLRTDSECAEMPIVLMIATDAAHAEADIRDADVNGYLTKPVKLTMLRTMLARIYGVKGMAPLIRTHEKVTANDWNRLKGMRVILAEDNRINQEVAVENLNSVGVHVDVAEDGMQVLKMVGDGHYDAVLMDIQMPDMDGYEATRKVRQMESVRHDIPIIAMTAHAMTGDREKCLESGMNGYVTKPIDPHKLFAEIDRCVEIPQSPEADQPLDEDQIHVPHETSAPDEVVAYTDEGFPYLEGFDVETGLQRVRGNVTLYRKLLVDFIRRNGSLCEELGATYKRGDVDELKKMVHTLKGTAGNLSAIALQKAALNLEDALKQRNMEDVDVRLMQLREIWENVLDAIDMIAVEEEPVEHVESVGKEFEQTDVVNMLQELDELLGQGSFDAEKLIQVLKPVFERAQCRDDALLLEQQMSDFDYKSAQETLATLADKMGIHILGKEDHD